MITAKIARFIVNTSYEDIPQEAISIAKECLLDGFGVALAGSGTPTGRIILDFVKEAGGNPEAGVIAGGFKTSPLLSALANGTLAHALDYDDHAITWSGHPTVVLLPPIFALAEKHRLSGRQVLEAYSLGWEVGSKLCSELANHLFRQGWHPTATAGTLAATVACAKLLGLNQQQARVALGIAASQAAGLVHNFGTDTKPFHAGKAASNAITAALLAQKGFTANPSVLEGAIGFCQALAKKDCDLDSLARSLGSPFDIITSASIKPYPACGVTHRCIDAMLYLAKEHRLRPDQVAEIECRIPAKAREIVIHTRPRTGLEGKFSLEYCMAAALIDGEVSLRQFTDDKVLSPAAQQLITRVKRTYIEGVEGENILSIPQSVRVELKDGTEYFHEVKWPKGYHDNPMSWDEVADKFRDCAEGVLSPADMDRAIGLLSELDSLPSVAELMSIVCKTKP